ncbi:MAG: hypothetical protein E6R04_11960 [Spirochaetes bacterium]|nr:MAG: hypothetical protein E6R04_11960 [Spirochaetota bacterium]
MMKNNTSQSLVLGQKIRVIQTTEPFAVGMEGEIIHIDQATGDFIIQVTKGPAGFEMRGIGTRQVVRNTWQITFLQPTTLLQKILGCLLLALFLHVFYWFFSIILTFISYLYAKI